MIGPIRWMAPDRLAAEIVAAEPEDVPRRMRPMVDYMASRTAFFDQFFLDATNAGVRQAVILATGLDSRTWRLAWPDGTTVYELDQPRVLEFKSSSLQYLGERPMATLVNVAVDLRQDWPTALQQAGFDASAPSAWIAEGLLFFLPAAAQDLLLERVHALAAAGSRIAVEALGPDFNNPLLARRREQIQRLRAIIAKLGEQHDIADFQELWYCEDRTDVGDWLRNHGWEVSAVPAEQPMARYDRRPPADIKDPAARNLLVSAVRRTTSALGGADAVRAV